MAVDRSSRWRDEMRAAVASRVTTCGDAPAGGILPVPGEHSRHGAVTSCLQERPSRVTRGRAGARYVRQTCPDRTLTGGAVMSFKLSRLRSRRSRLAVLAAAPCCSAAASTPASACPHRRRPTAASAAVRACSRETCSSSPAPTRRRTSTPGSTVLPPGARRPARPPPARPAARPATAAPTRRSSTTTPDDGSFGITSPIFLDELDPYSGRLLEHDPGPDQRLVTSFSSKSERALNLSTNGQVGVVHGLRRAERHD